MSHRERIDHRFPGDLPGGGAILATFVSYAVEKKISRTPEKFGKGAIEGVAGPESANNAAAGGSLIPLLSLGIPPNPVMAMLFSALIIHGIQPGLLIKNHPELFWGWSSEHVGNAFFGSNLPLLRGACGDLLRRRRVPDAEIRVRACPSDSSLRSGAHAGAESPSIPTHFSRNLHDFYHPAHQRRVSGRRLTASYFQRAPFRQETAQRIRCLRRIGRNQWHPNPTLMTNALQVRLPKMENADWVWDYDI
jgi:hypothetical protein